MYAGCIEAIRLAFVGDTQRVLPVERFAHPMETNDAGRKRVAKAIVVEPVQALIHLGDLVGCASDWCRFDRDYPPDVLASKPVHVCRGNHDRGGLWFGSAKEFERRYPRAIGRLQVVRLGCLRLLLLDSNRDAMSRELWKRQHTEFGAALDEADRDERVSHVVVACHHPPFTNARWHPPSRLVRDNFVKPFLDCGKARLFLSGHAHGYERFQTDGRQFIVSGGGGGARFSHFRGARCRQTAMIELEDPHPFHYVVAEVTSSAVSCVAIAVDECDGNSRIIDRF